MNAPESPLPAIDRRRLMQGAVVAGGAVWAVPTIVSLATPAAAASGADPGVFIRANTIVDSTSIVVPGVTTPAGNWVMVAAISTHNNRVVNLPPGGGWTSVLTASNTIGLKVLCKAGTGANASHNETFTWTGNSAAVAFVAVYRAATGWAGAAGPNAMTATNSAGSSTTLQAATQIAGTVAGSRILFIGAWDMITKTAVTATVPTGAKTYTYRTRVSFTQEDAGCGLYLADTAPTSGDSGTASSTLGTSEINLAALLAVH